MPTDKELMQQALDALINAKGYIFYNVLDDTGNRYDIAIEAIRARLEQNDFNPDWDAMAVMVEEQQRMAKRIEELEARLEQPEPKPDTTIDGMPAYEGPLSKSKRLAQPEQEWQGLTDEEITTIGITHQSLHQVARAIEANLKEKNT